MLGLSTADDASAALAVEVDLMISAAGGWAWCGCFPLVGMELSERLPS